MKNYQATVVIHDAEHLTMAKRKEIAEWLRMRVMRALNNKRSQFAKRLTFRLHKPR